MPRFADHLTGIADILHSSAEGGEVRINYGEETTGEGKLNDVQLWGPDGYIARPNDPSDAGAAQVYHVVEGQAQIAIATRDNRFAAQAGQLQPGDRRIVTDGPTRWFLTRAKGQVGNYTEAANAFPDGSKGMIEMLDGEAGTWRVQVGGCIAITDGTSWTLIAAGPATQASISITPTAVTITAPTVNIAGGFVALGLNSDGTLPGKPGVDTVTIGASGQSAIASPKVFAAQY